MLAVVIIFTKMEDVEFKHASKKINEFKTELKALINRYNFGKHESANYNGMEEFCETDLYFTVEGYIWYNESVSEILLEVGLK